MLDDLKYIAQKDTSDALGVAEKTPQQLLHSPEFEFKLDREIQNIVLSGMGGSALAGNLFLSWTTPNVPFAINRQYDIPGFVSKNTLFITSSYSGNTEEALSSLSQAEQKGALIVAMTSGGQLAEIAREKNYPIMMIPGNIQPRMSVFYQLKALSLLMDKSGLLNGLSEQLESVVQFLDSVTAKLRTDVPTSSNQAKQIAEELAGKTPVVYAGPRLSAVAYKWKISFNENAKNLAFYNQWPEFNHNEMLGWVSHPIEKPFQPIELISSFEHERISKRFEVTNRLLSGRMPHPIQVQAVGDTLLEQMLSTVLLGDFVSLYLAMLNNLDPTPVILVEKLKEELKD